MTQPEVAVSRWSVSALGRTVELRATPAGPGLAAATLGALLSYGRARSLRALVDRLAAAPDWPADAATRLDHEYYLTRAGVARVVPHVRGVVPSDVAAVYALFDAVGGPQAPEPAPARAAPVSASAAEPLSQADAERPLTPREEAALLKTRVEQAKFVTGLITARRITKELTPLERRQLAHRAAEIALGQRIVLAGVPVDLTAPPGAPSLAEPEPAPASKSPASLGSVIRGATLPNAPRAAAAAGPEAGPPGDPFDFPGANAAAAPAVDPKAWILSRYNPPDRSSATALAVLVGHGCTRQKIGRVATALGFKEGHPWVTTARVTGQHSKREDCTTYFYNREAALALIEGVLAAPTKRMRVRMEAARYNATPPVPGAATLN